MTRKTTEHREQRTLAPTGSYAIDVPCDANEQIDDGVVSLWLPDDDTLLQISSYKREAGRQIPAIERLEARLKREQLVNIQFKRITIADCPDIAAASGCDNESVCWIYVYAAWPDLTVLMTVSGAESPPESWAPKWALDAVTSLRRT